MKLKFPGIKILDRYIIGKFLGTYLFAIAMIIVIVVVFDYVEKVDDFTETKATFKEVILDYYVNFIPFFINQFSGLFTFIAVIFFTSKMAYQTEIIAIVILLQREERCAIRATVVAANVGKRAGLDLTIYMAVVAGVDSSANVLLLEIDPASLCHRDYPQ